MCILLCIFVIGMTNRFRQLRDMKFLHEKYVSYVKIKDILLHIIFLYGNLKFYARAI